MSLKLSWIPTFVALALITAPSSSDAVVIPDDYPTIQAALDAGETMIQVGDNLTPEALQIAHDVTIEPRAVPNGWLEAVWETSPMVASMVLGGGDPSANYEIRVRGMRFLGRVSLPIQYGVVVFESCRLDSGLVGPNSMGPGTKTSIRGCTILGNVTVVSSYPQFTHNTVIGGKVHIWADGLHDIRNNFVQGPADAGIEVSVYDSQGPIAWNTIRGVGDGFRAVSRLTSLSPVGHNDISDCSGDGIQLLAHPSEHYPANAPCDSNLIQRCAGSGIAVRNSSPFSFDGGSLEGNVILDSGQDGLHMEYGILYAFRNNVIERSGGHGVIAMIAGNVERNIIGRNGGDGMFVTGESDEIHGNTLFENGGAGIHLASVGSSTQLTHNISAANVGGGLVVESVEGAAEVGCNDWFQNLGGATVGIAPGATDLELDPMFCDLAAEDVHLASNSPLLDASGCGLIGALGEGCGVVGVASPALPVPAEVFEVLPMPSRGGVSFALPSSSEPGQIEVYDVTGARRWQQTVAPGARHAEWDAVGDGGDRLPPGVYFARLRRGDVEVARTRIVLTK